ncbi:MAG: potassium-transporting ATPase subunit KdpC [Burkholderiales bacterium]|nr:potassium-transporting ATPase subunit KdpC [Burkholderiales bacterium]
MTSTSSPAAASRHSHAPAARAPVEGGGAWRGALGLAVLSLAGFGFLYSLAGVGLGQALFPHTASGSLIERGGRVAGSALVAQPFVGDGYFQPRPSAAGYDPMALAGSNQARTNPELRKRLDETRAAVAGREGVSPWQVPGDLITQSGSGIDPHIGPEAAALQVARVARARGVTRVAVERLVARHTERAQWGVFGQPRVHVLALNLALDGLPAPRP